MKAQKEIKTPTLPKVGGAVYQPEWHLIYSSLQPTNRRPRMGAITKQPQDLLEYLIRLERQNRMLKRVGAVLFFLCFSAIGMVAWQFRKISRSAELQGQTKIIRATEFDLVDQNGKSQGLLSGGPDGAMLFLNGPNGKPGLMFFPFDKGGGSSLSLTSVSGEQLVDLTVGDVYSSVTVGTKE